MQLIPVAAVAVALLKGCAASALKSRNDYIHQLTETLFARYQDHTDSKECMWLIASNTRKYLSNYGKSDDFDTALKFAKDNELRDAGNLSLAFGAIYSYTFESTSCLSYPPKFGTYSNSIFCQPSLLELVIKDAVKPTSHLITFSKSTVSAFDYKIQFDHRIEPSVLNFICDTLERASSTGWKSTGQFAANVFSWFIRKDPTGMHFADNVLTLQLSKVGHLLQESSKARLGYMRNYMSYCGVADFEGLNCRTTRNKGVLSSVSCAGMVDQMERTSAVTT